MICKHCGTKNPLGATYCIKCGRELDIFEDTTPREDNANTNFENICTKERKCWKVFALIGKISGIVCLCVSYIPLVGLWFAVPGLVFSLLGKKSNDANSIKEAKLGFKLSVAGCVVSSIFSIVGIIVFVSSLAEGFASI